MNFFSKSGGGLKTTSKKIKIIKNFLVGDKLYIKNNARRRVKFSYIKYSNKYSQSKLGAQDSKNGAQKDYKNHAQHQKIGAYENKFWKIILEK